MTWASLQQDIKAYLERGSVNDPLVAAQLPELINFAERRISRELKVLGFIVNGVFTLQAGLAVYMKPDRWRQTVSLNVATSPTGTAIRAQVYPRSYEYVRSFWPDDTATSLSVYGVAAPPKFYADYGYQNFILAPTPDAAYSAELVYYEEPALLDATTQTNWITQYAPRLLLYAALIETLTFLKKGDRVPEIQALYDREAGMFNSEDVSKILDRSVTRQKD